jgi:hypothetical protein
MSSPPPPLPSLAEFLFNIPLYDKYTLDVPALKTIYYLDNPIIDGHCPFCHKQATFTVKGDETYTNVIADLQGRNEIVEMSITCARSEQHVVHFYILKSKMIVQKIGQSPSLADIANDESKTYRSVLTQEDSSEFHKAIGLAAHGVGIGSFVYLRRIFERLVNTRFEESKTIESWADEDFYRKRMAERVAFLDKHLPPFLIENARIYSILSLGLHELDEATCLTFFYVLKASIVLILDDDKKKKEELQLRNSLMKAIAKFTPESPTTTASDIEK